MSTTRIRDHSMSPCCDAHPLGASPDLKPSEDKKHVTEGGTAPCVLSAVKQAHPDRRQHPEPDPVPPEARSREHASTRANRVLVNRLLREDRVHDAAEACTQALLTHSDDAMLHEQMGLVQMRDGKWSEAATTLRRSVELCPESASAHALLASVCNHLNLVIEAFHSALRAIDLDPRCVTAHAQLGIALERQGRLSAACATFERVRRLSPHDPSPCILLGGVRLQQRWHESALALFREAAALAPKSHQVHEMQLLSSCYSDDVGETQMLKEHKRWAALAMRTVPMCEYVHQVPPLGGRALRVGYVSPDMYNHAVSHFLTPILAHHNRERVVSVVFSDAPCRDEITNRLRSFAAEWHDVGSLGDMELASLINRRGIDILVDLAGHTAHNRLPTFIQRPAPVQVTYLGYPHTTGLPRSIMRYRLTDSTCDPPGDSDELHTENLTRLPGCFLCYRPPTAPPPAARPPCRRNGRITFGCFNGLMKITSHVIAVWAEILRQVPDSQLMLKNRSLSDAGVRNSVCSAFADSGIDRSRLVLLPPDRLGGDHMARYDDVDIALDTFPYNGTTTTCEALWMGVPVVARTGNAHRSRVGATLLSAVGVPSLIAPDDHAYMSVARKLSESRDQLDWLRQNLRSIMSRSVLTDEAGFTRNLERVYYEMWHHASDGNGKSESIL